MARTGKTFDAWASSVRRPRHARLFIFTLLKVIIFRSYETSVSTYILGLNVLGPAYIWVMPDNYRVYAMLIEPLPRFVTWLRLPAET